MSITEKTMEFSKKTKNLLKSEIKKKVARAVIKTLNYIQQETPVNTGNLRKSIVMEETDDGYFIGTSVPYAEYVEMGTGAHLITPKNKQALFWQGANHPVKSVMHPGTEGQMMFHKGITMFKSFLKQEFSR